MNIEPTRVKDLTTKELESLIRKVVTDSMNDFLEQRVSQSPNEEELVVTETRIIEPKDTDDDSFEDSRVVKENKKKHDHPHISVKDVAKDLGLYLE